MSEYEEGEYKVDGEKAREYLERERFVTETVNRVHSFLKYYFEAKYETYYRIGEELHRLYNQFEWRSRLRMCTEVYKQLASEYRDEFTPNVLRKCLYFYEYVERKENVWNNFRKLFLLCIEKEEGKVVQSEQFTITGFLEGELKNIEEEVMEIFNTIRKVYPDYMMIEVEDIVRDLEPVKDLLRKSLKRVLGYRILWEMFNENIPDYRLIEAVKIGSAYRDKKTLEGLRREYKRLGARKPKRVPPIFCIFCGSQLDWDDRNIDWIDTRAHLTCLKEYLVKAITSAIDMPIEDPKVLELLLEELISKYNIEEVIEEGEG